MKVKAGLGSAVVLAAAIAGASAAWAQGTPNKLVWGVGQPVGNLDIAQFLEGTSRRLLKENVLEGLTRMVHKDGGLAWEPLLATEWKMVDPTHWRFTIREGVNFQDGSPLTAADVAYTVNKLADPASSKSGILANIAGATVVDDHTVEISTKSADFYLFRAAAEIPVQKDGWGKTNPDEAKATAVGTGPYKLVSVSPARDDAILEAWDGYWGQVKPTFTTIEARSIPDPGARLAALKAGEIQVAFDLTPDLLKAAPATVSTPSTEVAVLRINTAKKPLDDLRVRQALNLAVDRKVIIDDVRLGFAVASNGQPVPAPANGYNPNLKDYATDVEKAKALVKEAGAEGATITLMCSAELYGNVGLDTCSTLAAMYEEIGLKIEIQNLPFANWIKEGLLAPKNKVPPPDLLYLQAGSETLDSKPVVGGYLSCNTDRSTACDPELDALSKTALGMADAAGQAAAYQAVFAKAYDEAVMVTLFSPVFAVGVSPDVTGQVYPEVATLFWAEWGKK
jgi:peptide/nickel transport system substrate-binding protein